ncbi:MAG: putative rane-anchored protein [Pseudonocardiales bacterium]|nr:putative rane-anchored protein [Pseudonocardiales bacterium]
MPAMDTGVSKTGTVLTPATAVAVKVPEVTIYFWVVKALTTAFGESASDFMVHSINPVLAVLLGFIAFCAALIAQLLAPRYMASRYWLAVAMVGVFGTMAADVLHVGFGVPYAVSSVLFVVTLAAVFTTWYASERTLSIHSILTRRRELFYWAAVVSTFALGTAVGDLAAVSLRLGYFSSGIVFALAILVPAIGYWRFRLNAVAAFWTAYILTRPLGASFADWLGVSHVRGGLDLGPGPVSLALAGLIVAFVTYLARTKIDLPRSVPV